MALFQSLKHLAIGAIYEAEFKDRFILKEIIRATGQTYSYSRDGAKLNIKRVS